MLAAGVEEHFGAAPQQQMEAAQAQGQGAAQQAAPKKKKGHAANKARGAVKQEPEVIEL